MKLYLVTWDLSQNLLGQRMLHSHPYPNFVAGALVGQGGLTVPVVVESWILDDLEAAKKKASDLSNAQHKTYTVAEINIVGHCKPAVSRWEELAQGVRIERT